MREEGSPNGSSNQVWHLRMACSGGGGIYLANVQRAVTGIARYVVSQKPSGARVIVGRDPRFLGETFCGLAVDILGSHGITPLLMRKTAPHARYFLCRDQGKGRRGYKLQLSHNPPEYNGIKFSTADGAPALPELQSELRLR